MASRIDWDIQAAEALPLELPGQPEAEPLQASPRRAGPKFWLTYLAVLGVAAILGFGLGRWTEAQAGLQEGIDAALRLEALAWRRGDPELYEATLSPEADPAWRKAEMAGFHMDPEAEARPAKRIERLASDAVLVELGPSISAGDEGDGGEPELRHYRRLGERWYREPGPDRR